MKKLIVALVLASSFAAFADDAAKTDVADDQADKKAKKSTKASTPAPAAALRVRAREVNPRVSSGDRRTDGACRTHARVARPVGVFRTGVRRQQAYSVRRLPARPGR